MSIKSAYPQFHTCYSNVITPYLVDDKVLVCLGIPDTAGSSQANPFACIASGIAALWGPAHGGANEAVLRMLEQIGSRDNIPEAIKRAKDKQDSFR